MTAAGEAALRDHLAGLDRLLQAGRTRLASEP
jgi:hypothetical protein